MSASNAGRSDGDERVLVQVPTAKDAVLARGVLERAGIACRICSDLGELTKELDAGAAALLLGEELLFSKSPEWLTNWLRAQPPWSDLPVIVLARPGADSGAIARAMSELGNVTVIERPTSVATMVSAIRTALRARQRQYQIREHLIERERTEGLLMESDRRKDEFLAILAHELRNPLAPIRNSLHVLRIQAPHDPRLSPIVDMMERQVRQLVRLVDDLMEVSRISRGKIELRREPVTLSSVVLAAVEESRPAIDAARQVLTTELPQTPTIVEVDPARLAQVLSNLLNNASKFTPAGGRISLVVGQEAEEVVLSVRDTGVGIPAGMLSRVFELFTQVDRAPGRDPGGLGIGLTLVKQLVELHGGEVRAFSEGPGMGSEIVVRLPIRAESGSRAAPEHDGPEIQELPRHRILVVDDNRDATDSFAMLLRNLGAEVHVAYSGESALEMLRTLRPTAILLDITMPGMDGHEVARRVRLRSELQDVTLVALTGWDQEEEVARSKESGFDHHWLKPLDLRMLKELLASMPVRAGVS